MAVPTGSSHWPPKPGMTMSTANPDLCAGQAGPLQGFVDQIRCVAAFRPASALRFHRYLSSAGTNMNEQINLQAEVSPPEPCTLISARRCAEPAECAPAVKDYRPGREHGCVH